MKYYVRGGIFTDTTFTKVTPGTEEEYGPFDTYNEAYMAWMRGMFNQKLDICTHRLVITPIDSSKYSEELKCKYF